MFRSNVIIRLGVCALVSASIACGYDSPTAPYSDCPGVNRVGRLEPGQTMETGALSDSRSCGFLDLLRSGDSRWQGTIVVQ